MNEHEQGAREAGHEGAQTPTELRSVESALDRLGAHERDGFDGNFESRLVSASAAAARRPNFRPVGDGAPVARLRLAVSPVWRMAAAIALAAGLGIGWWALQTPSTAPAEDSGAASVEVAALLAEEPFSAAQSALEELATELAALESALHAVWSLDDELLLEDSL